MLEQAAILVGGLGTRLKAMGFTCPKPLVPVAGQPFVEHIVRHLAGFGIRRILMLAGHHGDQVVDLYDGKSLYNAEVQVLVEPEPRGTGGALRFAWDRLEDEFLLLNGDSILLSDFRTFVDTPMPPDVAGRLMLREIEDASRYGAIDLADNGRIRAIREKTAQRSDGPQLISAGIYRFRKQAIDHALPQGASSIETEVFPALCQASALDGIVRGGYFIDIGLPESYLQANDELVAALTQPAAFLDRDGVINIDHGYMHRVEDLRFTPTAIEGIRMLKDAGYRVFVVTNQAGVAKGHYGEAEVGRFHAEMQRQLRASGAVIDAFYYCPFHPEGTVPAYRIDHPDRKPGSGMLERAMRDFPTDAGRSFLIGDRETDIAAAEALGLPGYLVQENACDLAATVSTALQTLRERS
jgi:D,D-heptose 1,7-bisphosphate phosphatase